MMGCNHPSPGIEANLTNQVFHQEEKSAPPKITKKNPPSSPIENEEKLLTTLPVKINPALSPITFKEVSQEAGIHYQQGIEDEVEIFAMSGGASVGDYDGDGWLDLFVTRSHDSGILYRNLGNGKFKDVTQEAGLKQSHYGNGVMWIDVDNDGDLDLFVTTLINRFYLFINQEGHFEDEALKRGLISDHPPSNLGENKGAGYSIAVGDYNRDGWLDIHVNEWGTSFPKDGQTIGSLFKNNGAGKFENTTKKSGIILKLNTADLSKFNSLDQLLSTPSDQINPNFKLNPEILSDPDLIERLSSDSQLFKKYLENGTLFYNPRKTNSIRYAFASSFVDLDKDGWPELAIASDYETSQLFWNNQDETFTNQTHISGVGTDNNGMGSTFGDFNGDGLLDWFITAIFNPCAPNCMWDGNRLYKNNGDRTFSDWTDKMSVRQGHWGWGTDFFDYDNDGKLDLVMTNGDNDEPPFIHTSTILWHYEDEQYVDKSTELGITDTEQGRGLLIFDYDNDGDLDIFIVNNGAQPLLYRNDGGNKNNWLRVRVKTKNRRDAIGAKVTLKHEEKLQYREIGVGSHFLGQSENIAHFGLGSDVKNISEIQIIWPSGKTKILTNIPSRSTQIITES